MKSLIVNILKDFIRKIFESNDSVILCAPTGCASHNIGGCTCHRAFELSFGKNPCDISPDKQKNYVQCYVDVLLYLSMNEVCLMHKHLE